MVACSEGFNGFLATSVGLITVCFFRSIFVRHVSFQFMRRGGELWKVRLLLITESVFNSCLLYFISMVFLLTNIEHHFLTIAAGGLNIEP